MIQVKIKCPFVFLNNFVFYQRLDVVDIVDFVLLLIDINREA